MPLFAWDAGRKNQVLPPAAQDEIAGLASHRLVHEAFAWFRANEREIANFQIEISNVPAPPFGEEERSRFFAVSLEKLGYVAERDELGNVFARNSCTEPEAPALAISAHLDTVFPITTSIDVRRDGNRILGPGVSDNGAGLAGLWAVAALLKAQSMITRAPVLFIGNVGEEGEGDLRGFRHLLADSHRRSQIGAMLVLDGAGVESIISQGLGSRRFEVTVSGPGGHSWSDFGMPNPIVAIARIIEKLSQTMLPSSPRTTVNIGTICGGTSVNTIPESASIRIDIRSVALDSIDQIELHLRDIVRTSVEATQSTNSVFKHLKAKIRVVGDRPAAEIREDAPLMSFLRAVDSQLGIRATIHRASTDANIPLSMGIDALAIGAGGSGGGAHTLHEWFDPVGRDVALKRILLTTLAMVGMKE